MFALYQHFDSILDSHSRIRVLHKGARSRKKSQSVVDEDVMAVRVSAIGDLVLCVANWHGYNTYGHKY